MEGGRHNPARITTPSFNGTSQMFSSLSHVYKVTGSMERASQLASQHAKPRIPPIHQNNSNEHRATLRWHIQTLDDSAYSVRRQRFRDAQIWHHVHAILREWCSLARYMGTMSHARLYLQLPVTRRTLHAPLEIRDPMCPKRPPRAGQPLANNFWNYYRTVYGYCGHLSVERRPCVGREWTERRTG